MTTANKLNRARVADLHTTMTGYVERGDIPGIVTLIARDGEIHVDANRLPDTYRFNRESKKLEVFDSAQNSDYSRPPAFESGAGGLVSTADDYYAFCQTMLNKGVWGQERILAEASVELMTSDQLMPQQRKGAEIFFGSYSSWGFGMGVNIQLDEPWMTPGRFGWDGGFGTSAYSDPQNGFIGILLTQRMMDSPEPPAVFTDFWAHAYRSLEA